MSAPEFKALFNSNVFKYWFDKNLGNYGKGAYQSFVHTGRKESKKFINDSIVDFILPKERLASMLDPGTAAKLFNAAKKQAQDLAHEGIEYRQSPSGQEQIVIKDIKFSSIETVVSNVLDSIGSQIGVQGIKSQIVSARKTQKLDRGHVFGFGNTLLFRAKEELRSVSAKLGSQNDITSEQLDALDEYIDALIDVLEDFDIQTSDIDDLDAQIYAKYRKTATNWLIEWQADTENQGAGNKVGRILGRTGTATHTGARGVFTGKATEAVVKNFIQQFIDEGLQAPDSNKLNLLNQKSSPTLKDMIVEAVLKPLDDFKPVLQKEYSGQIQLPKVPVSRVDGKGKASLKKAKDSLVKQKQKVKAVRAKSKNAKVTENTTSLTSLKNLLDAHLQDVVSANMGDGSRRDILNYRTGRFASSVKVEKLSQSRDGMITAFYTYMKYPYATFSAGGRQQYPGSRDPKLLISKSIREIAAETVTNRLRAVLI
jgi:hypothetical protein